MHKIPGEPKVFHNNEKGQDSDLTFQDRLREILTEEQIRTDEPMSRHTTFRVGGPADYFLTPGEAELGPVVKLLKEEQIPLQIIGNGSNLLVGDKGIRGAVVEIGAQLNGVSVEGTRLVAQAGVSLARAAQEAARAHLSGLEFASGIPGTVGGAVVMNAGAYGGEMKDVVERVQVLCGSGELKTLDGEEMEFSYRHSIVLKLNGIVIKTVFCLEEADESLIRAKMELLKNQRAQKQPLEYASAGSTFKRPKGYFAGKLIMDAGLRGFQVGGAQVSEKHCGFVINRGDATAADILGLIRHVQKTVKEKFGVDMETEVRMIGEF